MIKENSSRKAFSNKYLSSLRNLSKNRLALSYILFAILAPILFYAIFSSINIPYTTRTIELDWVKYNQQSWILKQVISTYVFSLAILATLFFWRFRLAFAMLGLVLLLAFNLVTVELVVEYMNIPVILYFPKAFHRYHNCQTHFLLFQDALDTSISRPVKSPLLCRIGL